MYREPLHTAQREREREREKRKRKKKKKKKKQKRWEDRERNAGIRPPCCRTHFPCGIVRQGRRVRRNKHT